jgi:anaerobic magnesium-protoporphyrin IX monomethyl ester cyclase
MTRPTKLFPLGAPQLTPFAQTTDLRLYQAGVPSKEEDAGKLPASKVRPVERVQLFFPPMVFSRYQSRQTALFPLGLGYIASVLGRDGLDVELVDCPSEGYDTLLDIGKDRFVYGLTADEIRERIERFRPQAIGISCLFSTLEKRMMMIARIAKEVDPDIVVFVGGPHVSAFFKRVIKDPAIDYCVIAEGEQSTVELVRALNGKGELSSIEALCYRDGTNIVVQPRAGWISDLDTVPFPARNIVDFERYFSIGKVQGVRLDGDGEMRLAQMTTSRGCPFQCTYCAKNVTSGTRYRTRSTKNVLDEIEHLVERYGVQRIAFQDDNFTADMVRAAEICDGIVERKLDITWEAHNGLGVNYLSPELLEKMKASGCVSFTIAVESANDATLARVQKPNYIQYAPPIVKKAKELGIEVRGFFMIGFPGESIDEVWATVAYARQLNLAVTAFALVTPLPGTKLYHECVQAGMIDESTIDFEDFSFGAFDLQLSQVPVPELKVIRKIEWLKTILVDENDAFKHDVNMRREDVLEELGNGVKLFPDNDAIRKLYAGATAYYASA